MDGHDDRTRGSFFCQIFLSTPHHHCEQLLTGWIAVCKAAGMTGENGGKPFTNAKVFFSQLFNLIYT